MNSIAYAFGVVLVLVACFRLLQLRPCLICRNCKPQRVPVEKENLNILQMLAGLGIFTGVCTRRFGAIFSLRF